MEEIETVKWNLISDVHPPLGTRVLVWGLGSEICMRTMASMRLKDGSANEFVWFSDYDSARKFGWTTYHLGEYTHWILVERPQDTKARETAS